MKVTKVENEEMEIKLISQLLLSNFAKFLWRPVASYALLSVTHKWTRPRPRLRTRLLTKYFCPDGGSFTPTIQENVSKQVAIKGSYELLN